MLKCVSRSLPTVAASTSSAEESTLETTQKPHGTVEAELLTTQPQCTLIDVMGDAFAIPSRNVLTSSNQPERDNLRPGGQPWSSAAGDRAPSVEVRLSEASDVEISKIKPDNLDNVASYNVTITTASGKVVYQNVSDLDI